MTLPGSHMILEHRHLVVSKALFLTAAKRLSQMRDAVKFSAGDVCPQILKNTRQEERHLALTSL